MLTRWMMAACVMTAVAAGVTILNQTTPPADAHCQVPCGIYDDPARINLMLEDAATIRKAVGQMGQLQGKHDTHHHQQFVRWTVAKEQHASNIITVTSEYFLAQKIKPVEPDAPGYDAYLQKLATHHAVIVAAMKCKQHADMNHVVALEEAIHGIAHHWAPDHAH